MKIKINITSKDIENGRLRDCARCPVALAVNKALKKFKTKVSVGKTDITFLRNEGRVLLTSNLMKVQNFIERFDDYEEVKPFSFYINIPKDVYAKLNSK